MILCFRVILVDPRFVGQFCVSFQVLIMAYVSVWITQELDNQHGIRDTRFIWGNACEGERVGAGVQRERLQSDGGLTSVKGERKGQASGHSVVLREPWSG